MPRENTKLYEYRVGHVMHIVTEKIIAKISCYIVTRRLKSCG